MKIIENKLFKDIKRALINPFGKKPIVDKRFGTFDKKTYRAIDVSLDPFDPENADDLRGLTPQEYKNGQDLKISDRKKYKALNRQWYIDLYVIYNENAAIAGDPLIPQSEIDQIGDSFITEDEIAEYPEVVFKADSGALSIHAIRDLMKERWEDFTTKEDPGGLLYGFFFFWYLRVKLDRTGTVD